MSEQNSSDPTVLLLLEHIRALRNDLAESRREHREELQATREENRAEISKLREDLGAEIKDLRKGLNVFDKIMTKAHGAWWLAGMLFLAVTWWLGIWDKLIKLWP